MRSTLDRAQEAMRIMAAEARPATTMPDIVRRRVRRRQGRTILATSATLAVVVGASTVGVLSLRSGIPDRPGPVPASTTWSALPAGWTELPTLPEGGDGAAYVWAGDRLIALGGPGPDSEEPSTDAFSLGPDTSGWTRLSSAPLPALGPPQAAWTGREAIFFGVGRSRWKGEAYDPLTDTWRLIADPPGSRREGAMTVWTGSELILWGGASRGEAATWTRSIGHAYDPATDRWRPIADAPILLNQGNAVWTGHQVVVFGSLLGPNNNATTRFAIGAEYVPETDTWTTMPSSSLSPQADSVAWSNFGLVAWDYLLQAQVGDVPAGPGGSTWGDVRDIPLHPGECFPDSATVANDAFEEVFGWYCGQAALWNPADATWKRVGGGPLDATVQAGDRTIPLYQGGDPISAGRTVVLPLQGVTVSSQGEPCYGCEGSPNAIWAFRPQSNLPTAAEIAPPMFAPDGGWNTVSTSTDPAVLDPESSPYAWAANVPFSERDLAGSTDDGALTTAVFPSRTARSLPVDGVLITASLYPGTGPESPNVNFPDRELPLRISDAEARTSWEGQIAPNVPEYVLLSTVDGRFVEIRAYFGTLDPSPSTLEAAQEELDRLRLPPAP